MTSLMLLLFPTRILTLLFLLVPSMLPATKASLIFPVGCKSCFIARNPYASGLLSVHPRHRNNHHRSSSLLVAFGRGRDESGATSSSACFLSKHEREVVVTEFERDFGVGTSRARGDRMNKILLYVTRQVYCLIAVVAASWFFLPLLSNLDFLFLSKDVRSLQSYSAFTGLSTVAISGLSITLGTLVSMTISVLRQRQQDIRRCMSQEAVLLEAIAQQHVKLFRRDKIRLQRSMTVLSRYIAEKRRAISVSIIFGCDGVPDFWRYHWSVQNENTIEMLDILAECGDNTLGGPLYGFSPTSSSNTLVTLENMLINLNNGRAERRSVLESKLPGGLYATIIAFMLGIMFSFLLRADIISCTKFTTLQAFLSETPVRLLFVLMSSSFFSLLQIISDLQDPFDGGSFRIDPSVVDLAEARVEGALALANLQEDFEEELLKQAVRPDMRRDDNLTPGIF
mmetsp:Transcript_29458/g.35870  ORF Transcript_29458/g.35870 Transcript_29458/m.35870 type:complete len:454 (-) Transcript_29458:80-1441(-)